MTRKSPTDGLAFPKSNLIRDRKHLDWLKTLVCAKCGNSPCEPAHVRKGAGKARGGIGMKPGDNSAVPLCHWCHADQHQRGEDTCWPDLDKAHALARGLYAITGQTTAAMALLRAFRFRMEM